jgi:hypothetical protein
MRISRVRRWAPMLVLLVFLAVAANPASAADYQGATAYWTKLTLSASSGELTTFVTETGRLQTCSGVAIHDSTGDPVDITYAGGPIAITGGAFHLTGTTVDDWSDPFTWTADGTVSRDGREITGTITAGGDTRIAKGCTGSWPFDAVIAPGRAVSPSPHAFQVVLAPSGPSGYVTFDYAKGAISHLYARVGVVCPDSSVFPADLNSTAYGLDPIRVSKAGRFAVAGAMIDSYGVIDHYSITGRITGTTARGTLSSYRYEDGPTLARCASSVSWKAQGPTPVAPVTKPAPTSTRPASGSGAAPATSGPVASGPTAYFDVDGYRRGTAGAWSYYVIVKISGCTAATRARVAIVGGPTESSTCAGEVRLGPLTPKRTYQVSVTAIGSRAQQQPLATIYLPGDDGNWVRI